MVHLEDAGVADGAVVGAVRLDQVALGAQSQRAGEGPTGERQALLAGDLKEQRVLRLVGRLVHQLVVLGVCQPVLRRGLRRRR